MIKLNAATRLIAEVMATPKQAQAFYAAYPNIVNHDVVIQGFKTSNKGAIATCSRDLASYAGRLNAAETKALDKWLAAHESDWTSDDYQNAHLAGAKAPKGMPANIFKSYSTLFKAVAGAEDGQG